MHEIDCLSGGASDATHETINFWNMRGALAGERRKQVLEAALRAAYEKLFETLQRLHEDARSAVAPGEIHALRRDVMAIRRIIREEYGEYRG